MPWFQNKWVNQPWPIYAFFEIFVGHLDICLLSSTIRFTEFEEPEESINIKYYSLIVDDEMCNQSVDMYCVFDHTSIKICKLFPPANCNYQVRRLRNLLRDVEIANGEHRSFERQGFIQLHPTCTTSKSLPTICAPFLTRND